MKRKITFLAGAAAAALVLAGCTASGGGSGDGGDAQSDEPITLGLVTSLTGPLSTLGVGNEAGVKAAVEKVNSEGGIDGRPIEIVTRDDKSDSNQSVVAFNEVAADDKVVAVIGSTVSTAVSAVAPQAERASVPYVGLAPVDSVASGDFSYSFIVPAPVSDYAKRLSEYWADQGVKKIGVAYDSQDVYGEVGAASTEKFAAEEDIEVPFNESFDPTSTDFTALLTKFRNSDAEGLVVWGSGAASVIITKQYRELGIDKPLYMAGAQGSKLFLEPAGEAADGMIVATSMPVVGQEVPEGEQRTLIDQAVEAFDEDYYPTEFYFNGYASVLLLAEAMKQADSLDRESIRDAYGELDMVAPTGHYRISPENHSGLTAEDVSVSEVVDGEFVMTEFQKNSFE
ncbi:MAG: ABC transporter substrate-binding protein [Leucobacter sp.]